MNFLTMSLDCRPKWQLPFCKSGVHQFLNITNKFQFPVGHILLRRLALCVIGGGPPLLAGIDGGDNSLFQMLRPGPHNGCWPGSQAGDNERESWYTLSLIVLDISGVIIMDGPHIHWPILSSDCHHHDTYYRISRQNTPCRGSNVTNVANIKHSVSDTCPHI